MANNQYVNQVAVNGTTIIDLTADTVTPSTLLQGYTAHDASGAAIVGTATGDNSLIVTLSWDDDYFGQNEGAWVPDCTFAEIRDAYQAGKEITVQTAYHDYPDEICADGFVFYDSDFPLWRLIYAVKRSELDGTVLRTTVYCLGDDSGVRGLIVEGEFDAIIPNFDSPTRTYTPTTSQQTETITYDPNDGYNGIEQVSVTVNAMPTGTAGTPTATKGAVDTINCNVTVTPTVTNTTGYITGGTKTGTGVTVTAAELVAGNTLVADDSGNWDVTKCETLTIPAGTAGTPSAVKGSVSNHSVSVTPSVTNAGGWINGGTKTGTAVSVTASELVSGSQTVTQNGTVDVTNLASVVVDVQGSTPSLHVGFISVQSSYTNDSLTFINMLGEPTSWAVLSNGTIATSSTATVASVVSDGSSAVGQTITNTSNAQVSYNTGFFETYLADYSVFQVSSSSAQFGGNDGYSLVYTYGGGAIDTKQVQVGSGATSITFTGLEDEPACWYVIFQSNFSTSSGYQRVIAVANNGTDTYGLEMDSSAHYSDQHWTSSYSNGSLTITSQGTNAGGYFHQPGNYLLVYAYDASGNYQSKTVTPSQSTQEVTADSGYDALRKVTVNPIPSEYIVPTGNLAITSNTAAGQSINVSQYATATVNVPTGGGSASVATTTWSNSSNTATSHQFTNLSGTPKAAFLRCTSSLSRSSGSSNYFIADMVWNGTSCKGNSFRRSNGTYANVTSGYTVTTGSNSITFTSSGTSTTNPGSFYNGSYELTYVY